MEIHCGSFCIRSYRLEDGVALVRYADNPRIAENLRERFPHPYTHEDAAEWVSLAVEQDPETNFAIALDDELIGTIGLRLGEDVYRHSAEVGYWVGEPFWGRGIATCAVDEITAWGFGTFGLLRVFAYVFSENAASMCVLENAGFDLEARMRQAVVKNGRVMDQMLYARLASP